MKEPDPLQTEYLDTMVTTIVLLFRFFVKIGFVFVLPMK